MSSRPAPNLADDSYVALLAPPAIDSPLISRLTFALHAAVLAPSVHNTQPWQFRLEHVTDASSPYVDLLMDTGRSLLSLDPTHRQLVISCGAALAAYELGLRGCGLEPHVELFPTSAEPGCLARIRVSEIGHRDLDALQAWSALRDRRSYRGPMTSHPVESSLQQSLTEASGAAARLTFVPQQLWRMVERIVAEATLELTESTSIQSETASWTRTLERSSDGVPAANWQRTSEQTVFAPVLQRDFAQSRPLPGTSPANGVEADPLLAVFATETDTPIDWMNTGMALLKVALLAQAEGLALGYVNQPTEVPEMRRQLAEILPSPDDSHGVPQLVVRLGYPAVALPPATPRRTVPEVLVNPWQ